MTLDELWGRLAQEMDAGEGRVGPRARRRLAPHAVALARRYTAAWAALPCPSRAEPMRRALCALRLLECIGTMDLARWAQELSALMGAERGAPDFWARVGRLAEAIHERLGPEPLVRTV